MRRVLLAALLLAGCAPKLPKEGTGYAFLVDRSGSMSPAAKEAAVRRTLYEVDGLPDGARVTVFRIGARTEEIFSGEVGEFELADLATTLRRHVSRPARHTNLPRAFAAAASWCARSPGEKRLRFLTDGMNDALDAASVKRMRDAAAAITKARPKEILFHGVRAGYREPLRTLLPSATFR